MSFNISAKVTGAQEARAAVDELANKIGRGAMRDALTKAGRLVVAKVKTLAPVGATGLLKKSIRQKVITKPKKQSVTVLIGPANNVTGQIDRFGNGKIETVRPAKYAHLVEFGTASRGVYGKKGLTISPGNPLKPFMRPAYEQTKVAVREKYAAELGPGIEKTAAKIRKRKVQP
jgi:HK97 gp10 family phage protein